MRKIKLVRPEQKAKGYTVFLDFGLRFDFTNKKKANLFTTKVNRFLTDSVVTLVKCYKDLHNVYLDNFLLIDDYIVIDTLGESFENVKDSLNRSVEGTHGDNHNFFMYNSILKVYRELNTISSLLYQHFDSQTPYQQQRLNVKVISKSLSLFYADFKKFDLEVCKTEYAENFVELRKAN